MFLLTLLIASSFVSPYNQLSNQNSSWLQIENEYFIIFYKDGYYNDAIKISNISLQARIFVMEAFPHNLTVKVKIYLYDFDTWYGGIGVMYANPKEPSMSMLTPSEAYARSKWQDDLWYLHGIVHEYTHVATLYEVYLNGYDYLVPEWLSEGTAEYFAVFHTTSEIKEKYLRSYRNYYDDVKEKVVRGEGYLVNVVSDWYYQAPFVVMYMYETYGKERFVELFNKFELGIGFSRALKESFNVTQFQFEVNWLKWAVQYFNASASLYPEIELYDFSFDAILRKYYEIYGQYVSLKNSYDQLIEYLDTIKQVDKKLENLNDKVFSLESEINSLRSSLDSLFSKIDDLNFSLDSMIIEVNVIKRTLIDMSISTRLITEEIKKIESNFSSSITMLDKIVDQLSHFSNSIEYLNNEIGKINGNLAVMSSNVEDLGNIIFLNFSNVIETMNNVKNSLQRDLIEELRYYSISIVIFLIIILVILLKNTLSRRL